MSQTTQPVAAVTAAAKKRRTRTASAPKPAFVILQVLGDDGQPQQIDKRRVKIVAVERSAEKVMEAMEEGTHSNAFYLRFIVPSGPRQPQRGAQKQEAQAA